MVGGGRVDRKLPLKMVGGVSLGKSWTHKQMGDGKLALKTGG